MKLYWGDQVNGWRIWGFGFTRGRYLTVAMTINDWEAREAEDRESEPVSGGEG